MDFGLLVIRLVIGLVFAAHGAQKLFGAFGGHGLAGTGAYMESIGFRPGRRHAEIAGVTELAGGASLAIGLLTPFAAAAVIGTMVVAAVGAHGGKAFFLTSGGYEYTFVMGAVAAGLAFTGAGIVSFDALLDLDLGGIIWGTLGVALGVGAGAAQLGVRRTDSDEIDEIDEIDIRDDAAAEQADHEAGVRLTS